jgi:hypothetical protein
VSGLDLHIDPEALEPLIRRVAEEVAARLDTVRGQLPERLCYSEEEAAAQLGLRPHQLRDERLRGRIKASQIVGRRVRYLRDDLIAYLLHGRVEK